jgi:hypothetical protein
VEVSHCYMLKSFPCNIDKLGVWRKWGRKTWWL